MGRIWQCFAGCIGSEMNHVGYFVLFARSKYYFQIWLNNDICSIGVRGVFLQRGGISQPSILLACFNSAGGVNAGL